MSTRIAEGASGRTANMEVGELSRAIGKPWKVLWPKLPKQEERTDVGQALSPDQEKRLLDTAGSNKRWRMGATMIRIGLLTGMRIGEITCLAWGRADMSRRVITCWTREDAGWHGAPDPHERRPLQPAHRARGLV